MNSYDHSKKIVGDHFLKVIEQTIKHVETAASNGLNQSDEIEPYDPDGARGARFIDEIRANAVAISRLADEDGLSEDFLTVARTTASAAQSAANLLIDKEPSDDALKAVLSACRLGGKVADGIVRDFKHIATELLPKGEWDKDSPIRPTDFGPMWPNGTPDGWPMVDHLSGHSLKPRTSGEAQYDALYKRVLKLESSSTFQELRDKLDKADSMLISLIKGKDEHDDNIHSQTERLSSFIDKTEQRLKGLEEAFRVKKAAEAPIDYWEDRADTHRRQFWGWSIALGVAGAIAVLFIAAGLAKGWIPDVSLKDTNPWRLGSMALIGTLFLLMLRVMTRIVMSNLHLATESKERVVMLQAYLALAEQGEIDASQRTLILQALFRPSTTGLVKDDAVPASVLDLATRVASGGGKPTAS